MFVFKIAILLFTIHQIQGGMTAIAVLYGDNSMTSYGTLTFSQDNANANVRITGTLSGLNISSAHGFHVHVNAVSDGLPNCTAAGAHFNPYGTLHGPRTADIANRHVGDLGNITTDAYGVVTLDIYDGIIQLYNQTQSIMGRTVIVHGYRDDGGMGGFVDSSTTGNAGARITCGLIKSKAFNLQPTLAVLLITLSIIFSKLF